jgi:hypothetical protein
MANPQLTKEQREKIFAPLFVKTKAELERLSAGNDDLLFALRRKLAKDLGYLERDGPAKRKQLKRKKRMEQNGLCAICAKPLPEKGAELDRFEAKLGYTPGNTRLVHHECHIEEQEKKKYA